MRLVFNARNKDIFEMLRDGSKQVETRAATKKYQNLKKGDQVTFSCKGEAFIRTVSNVTHFESVVSLLKKYKPSQINPKLTKEEDLVMMYHSFPGYKEKIEKSGLIAIEFVK